MEDDDASLKPPGDLLTALMEFDELDSQSVESQLFPFRQQFPETARWCLSALKNLTRPQEDGSVCQILIDTGVVPLIFRYITIGVSPLHTIHACKRDSSDDNGGGSQSSSCDTPSPTDPVNR